MGKLRSFESFGLIYARLAEILSIELRNLQKLAYRQVTSFLTNKQSMQKQTLCSQWEVCYKWHKKLRLGRVADCLFDCMNQALCVCLTTPTQSNLFCFFFSSLSSGRATTAGRLLGPEMEISVKPLFQKHHDALPVLELNQVSTTFQSLTLRFSTELSPPPE